MIYSFRVCTSYHTPYLGTWSVQLKIEFNKDTQFMCTAQSWLQGGLLLDIALFSVMCRIKNFHH